MSYNKELDVTGLNCPLPILRTKKALVGLQSGQTVYVIATDPGSVKDFQAYTNQSGDKLLESKEENGKFIYVIEKK